MVALATALWLGACSPSVPSFDSAVDAARHLEENDVTCTDHTPLPEGSLVEDSLRCTGDEGNLEIYIFSDEDDMNDWLKVGRGLNGLVTGPDWAIVAGDQAEAVSSATGGTTN